MKLSDLITVHVTDMNPDVVLAYRSVLSRRDPNSRCTISDIFEQYPIDALLSPGNSSGDMGGGIEADYKEYFGQSLQDRVTGFIVNNYGGHLSVGDAIIVPTNNERIPYIIETPTKRSRLTSSSPEDITLATEAALTNILQYNAKVPDIRKIKILGTPGLGTLMGGVDPQDSALAFARGYDIVENKLKQGKIYSNNPFGK